MSLRYALQGIAFVLVVVVLLWTLLAMGPIAWLVIGAMLIAGVLQVQRRRDRRSPADAPPAYCPNCGVAVDTDRFDADDEWDVTYCVQCGAPLASDPDGDGAGAIRNCPDCGAPNDATAADCGYCGAAL